MINGISPALMRAPANETEDARAHRLREVTREFESVFLEIILRQMRASTRSVNGEKIGMDREVYDGWQDQQMARSMSSGSGIGLADMLYRQLQKEQLLREASTPE